MKYTENYTVMVHDVGHNGFVRPSVLWRYMQETANHQMRDEKPSYDELLVLGKAFILSRMNMISYCPLFQYEPITVETWAVDGHSASFERGYRIMRDGGRETVAEGMGVWALVDTASRRLCRKGETELHYSTDLPLKLSLPSHFRLPQDIVYVNAGTRDIRYSDVDCNLHMNNTNYPDMLCDFIPDIDRQLVTAVCINYVSEAPLGETLTVFRGCRPGEDGCTDYFFETKRDGAVNVQALVRMRPANAGQNGKESE